MTKTTEKAADAAIVNDAVARAEGNAANPPQRIHPSAMPPELHSLENPSGLPEAAETDDNVDLDQIHVLVQRDDNMAGMGIDVFAHEVPILERIWGPAAVSVVASEHPPALAIPDSAESEYRRLLNKYGPKNEQIIREIFPGGPHQIANICGLQLGYAGDGDQPQSAHFVGGKRIDEPHTNSAIEKQRAVTAALKARPKSKK